jgi:predicted phosphodiesterase
MKELRRAGLRAMGEVSARLDLGDAYVVFGHTHRPGPLPGDAEVEWRGRGGARLVNAGSWTFSRAFVTTAGDSPYWPGTYVLVEDNGPPVVTRLLLDRTLAQVEPSRRRRGS